MKADTPETRAWLALWNQWQPDLFIDCHVTNGADYRCNITFQHEHHDGVAPSVLAWEKRVFDDRVAPATEAAGNVISWYFEFIDNRDLPRAFETSMAVRDSRPVTRHCEIDRGYLIETHMLKPYRPRVIGTYDFLRFALAEVNSDPESLFEGREAG